MDFPKPVDKRPQLTLATKSGVISKIEELEAALKQRADELAEVERRLGVEKEQLDMRTNELETKTRTLVEGEMLLKNQRALHQKQIAKLMEQDDLLALRAELDQREDAAKKKEAFLGQMEKRMTDQFSAREQDLLKREAWVSSEHEKATLQQSRRLQAIVFTDVVSYSALMQTDESGTIRKVRADLERMNEVGKAQGGMRINTMGDGMLMIFPSAIQAVRFSLAMQRTFNLTSGPGGLRHRFGVHIADVALLQDGGIAGDGVNVASRLESKAPNGGICISSLVQLLVKGKLQLPPGEVEQIELKNITEPVAVYKYTPEAILSMIDPERSTPSVVLPEEERTAPPFAFTQPGGRGASAGN